MITVDELRKLDGQIFYNPLGVIKYRFRGDFTYHFYSDLTKPLNDYNVHTHRYSFTSTVKRGELKNIIYNIEPQDESNFTVYKCLCRVGDELLPVRPVSVSEAVTFTTKEEQSYDMDYHTFHTIELLTPSVVTLIRRSTKQDQFAQFIVNTNEEYIPYENEHIKSEKECWELVEYTLSL